jgi:YidC/Oxa1 family membrane protein insertase
LPVFLGLYRGVRNLAMEDKLNESFLWIPSLEGPVRPPDYRGMEWLTEGWSRDPSGGLLPIPDLGWETTLAFLTMPVILVLLQSFTMQTLQPPMDENATEEEKKSMETSQTVMKFLPLMIGFFSLSVPAGLTIYWFTSNLYTLTQSVVVKAYFRANPPKIDLPDYWETALSGDAENMSPEEKRKASEAGLRIGPTFEDLIVESKFHKLIVRKPLRTTTDALAMTSTTNAEIPEELAEWVKNGPRVEVVATARV